MATVPSPYGRGPYGVGRYSAGTGTLWLVAGQSQVAFSVGLKPTMVYGLAAPTSITLLPQVAAILIGRPAAAAQISFSLQTKPSVVYKAGGQTQISFSVQGEIVKTWQEPGPCFVPCEDGAWTPVFPPWVVRELA